MVVFKVLVVVRQQRSDGETTEEQLAEALSQNQTLSETVYTIRTDVSDLAKKLKRNIE